MEGLDIEGTNPGDIIGATNTKNRHDYQHKALSFDGDDLVELESSVLSLDHGTISIWFYYDLDQSFSNEQYRPLFGSYNSAFNRSPTLFINKSNKRLMWSLVQNCYGYRSTNNYWKVAPFNHIL